MYRVRNLKFISENFNFVDICIGGNFVRKLIDKLSDG
jgi:hypothetical protein